MTRTINGHTMHLIVQGPAADEGRPGGASVFEVRVERTRVYRVRVTAGDENEARLAALHVPEARAEPGSMTRMQEATTLRRVGPAPSVP